MLLVLDGVIVLQKTQMCSFGMLDLSLNLDAYVGGVAGGQQECICKIKTRVSPACISEEV